MEELDLPSEISEDDSIDAINFATFTDEDVQAEHTEEEGCGLELGEEETTEGELVVNDTDDHHYEEHAMMDHEIVSLCTEGSLCVVAFVTDAVMNQQQ